jgi:hypothetical protein
MPTTAWRYLESSRARHCRRLVAAASSSIVDAPVRSRDPTNLRPASLAGESTRRLAGLLAQVVQVAVLVLFQPTERAVAILIGDLRQTLAKILSIDAVMTMIEVAARLGAHGV